MQLYIKRILGGVLLLLVLVLGFVAISSLVTNDEDDAAADDANSDGAPNPDGPGQGPSGGPMQIDDLEFPLTIECRPAQDSGAVYVIYVHNRGASSTSYIVAADLTSGDGSTVEAIAEVNDLRSGEQREAVLLPAETIGQIDSCAITAIQGDRRVLLSR